MYQLICCSLVALLINISISVEPSGFRYLRYLSECNPQCTSAKPIANLQTCCKAHGAGYGFVFCTRYNQAVCAIKDVTWSANGVAVSCIQGDCDGQENFPFGVQNHYFMPNSINYVNISLEDPDWLKTFWYSNGWFTIFINFFGIYIILWHSSKDMKIYKYYLLHILLWCFFQDWLMNWFVCPGFMMPLEGFYFSTSCYFSKTPPEWMWYETIFMIAAFENVTISLTDCFLHRLWCLEEKRWYQSTKSRQNLCFLIIHLIYCLSNAFALYFMGLDREVQLNYIFQFYPNTAYLANYTNWVIMPFSISRFSELCCMWVIEIGFYNFLNIFAVVRIYSLMKNLKSHMSAKTLQAHREFIISLTVQCLLTFSVYSVPTLAGIIGAISGYPTNVFGYLMVAIFCMHSAVNVVVMCWATKPYRNAIIEGARRILFRKFTKSSSKISISVTSPH